MKAILVVDIPDGYDADDVLIDYTLHTKGVYKALRKGGNLELIPLPSKRRIPFTKTFGTPFKKGKAKGWNDCLDEIMGETE